MLMADLVCHKAEMNATLVVTGVNPVPVEICRGVITMRQGMTITHEEADTMIIQQVASIRGHHVLVVAGDTDVFVLLCHFVFHHSIKR